MGSPLIIRNTQCPGDITVLSAAIRDLHLRHPGKFDVSMCVSGGSEHIFNHNPYIQRAYAAPGRNVKGNQFIAHYPLIKQCNQERKHFIWGFIEHMNSKLHTDIKLTDFRPDIHMSEQEIAQPIIDVPYWLFLSGGKTDFRTKIWSRQYWQQVITATKNEINWVQCGGGSKNHIMHEQIDGVYSYMVKKTSLRDFIKLIYHADGVVCTVTAAMHMAAAFNKPCVVIAGGREPWWWEAYTNENRIANMRVRSPHWQLPLDDDYVEHTYLHMMDKLPCCKGKGCWKSKLTKTSSCCTNVVEIGGQQLPKCKAMITPELVIDSIFKYYKDGVIGKKKHVVVPIPDTRSVFCLYGQNTSTWYEQITSFMPANNVLSLPDSINRLTSIKSVIERDSEWIFWFESESMLLSHQWLSNIRFKLSELTVKGRIYRTANGKLYPHPGCFIAPTKLLNKDADSYIGLFDKLTQDHFTALGNDIQLIARRPCLATDIAPVTKLV